MNDALISLLILLTTLVVFQGCQCVDYQPTSGPRIVAHRGASADAPENTIASFRLGFDQGADAVEGDFQLTADGHIVAMHDRTLSRTTGDPRATGTVTLSDLESLSAGNWGPWEGGAHAGEGIPTLPAVLEMIPEDRGLLIEIKDSDRIVPILVRELERSEIRRDRVTVISFDRDVVAALKHSAPGWKTLWLTSFSRKNGTWGPTVEQVIKVAKAIGADGVGVMAAPEVVDRDFVNRVKSVGLEIHVWTVNEAELAREMKAIGVDSITTDRPLLIRTVIGDEGRVGRRSLRSEVEG